MFLTNAVPEVSSFIEERTHPSFMMTDEQKRALYGKALLTRARWRKHLVGALYLFAILLWAKFVIKGLVAGFGYYISSVQVFNEAFWTLLLGVFMFIVGTGINTYLSRKEAVAEYQRLLVLGVIEQEAPKFKKNHNRRNRKS